MNIRHGCYDIAGTFFALAICALLTAGASKLMVIGHEYDILEIGNVAFSEDVVWVSLWIGILLIVATIVILWFGSLFSDQPIHEKFRGRPTIQELSERAQTECARRKLLQSLGIDPLTGRLID